MIRSRSQGALVVGGGVHYRTWSRAKNVEAVILTGDGRTARVVNLASEKNGYFSGLDSLGKAGDLYQYRLDNGAQWPDPASCFQPNGVHGASMVIDSDGFNWTDRNRAQPLADDLIIYEMHVGTFTPQGTFIAAIQKLDHLVALGVNCIELMPLADFPGDRNWGYDGVMLYAPSRIYGTPDDLRRFVDAAHARDLAVIVDVVYNHLGPDGNYVGCYHPGYFNPAHKTPWGDGFNFKLRAVRDFFAENAPYWIREFHVDGFRLDATHAIWDDSEPHILQEISARIHDAGGFVIAEDDRNEPALLQPSERGGFGFEGCWSDDFHHVVRVMMTRQREAYFRNFQGTSSELAETLQHGWLFRGDRKTQKGEIRGGDTAGLPPSKFVYCISNHDQTGNRAFGERLGQVADPAAYRAASALLCLVPQTPLLFMGQEWNASTPFQFFTDHNQDLGAKVTAGRRAEFGQFADFADPEKRAQIPDPQDPQTFFDSKLRWEESSRAPHSQVLELYTEFLQLRRSHPVLRSSARKEFRAVELAGGILAIVFSSDGRPRLAVLADLTGDHPAGEIPELPSKLRASWVPLLSSNEQRFGGSDELPFVVPTTLVLEAR